MLPANDDKVLSPADLIARASNAPGSLWAYDLLTVALAEYDRRMVLANYIALQRACVLCGHEGGPCISWARKRVGQYGAGFSTSMKGVG